MNMINKKMLIGFLAVCIILITVRMSGLHHSFNLTFFKTHAQTLKSVVENYYFWAVSLYIAVYITVIACMIPGCPALTIFGGYAFGPWLGCLYATVSATIGSFLTFILVRFFAHRIMHAPLHQTHNHFLTQFNAHGGLYVFFLVLLPITPFSVITSIAGISTVGMLAFMVAVFLGTLPGNFVYALAGRELMNLTKPSDVFTGPVFWGFVIMALLSLVPLLIKRWFEPSLKNDTH